MEIKAVTNEYRALEEPLRGLAAWVSEQLAPLEQDPALEVHQVASRVKSLESLLAKVALPDRTYSSLARITDLLGVRVVTYFEDAIPRIQDFIEQTFEVDYRNSVDKGEGLGTSRFGYRSVHIICLAPEPFSVPGPGGGEPIPFEIQIRTVLQHAWAQIEHDLGYKTPEAVPNRMRRKFSRLASLLEIADEEFVQIRHELAEHEEAVRRHDGEAWQGLEIDIVSLPHLSRRGWVQQQDWRLAGHLGLDLVEEPFHPEYLVRVLQTAGLATVQQVERASRQLGPKLPGFVDAYFSFAARQWDFGPDRVKRIPRGYSLLFVAYFHLLRCQTPGISPLERVTRFLQITDRMERPESQAAAQLLLSVFDDMSESI